jgi:hypothetical protein
MRRAFVLVTVAAAVVLAAQPAGAKGGEQKRTIAEIGAALEAHGITPCEERDWIKKVHGEEGDWAKKAYGDRDVPKKSVIAAIRTRVVVANRPCPDRADYDDDVDWERAADDYLTFALYKSKSSKAYKKQTKDPDIYAYKQRALILRPTADVLQEPFMAAMTDLGARPELGSS